MSAREIEGRNFEGTRVWISLTGGKEPTGEHGGGLIK